MRLDLRDIIIKILYFISVAAFFMFLLSGCVADSGHVKKGDLLIADLAKNQARLHQDDKNAAILANRAVEHAQESPAIIDGSQVAGVVGKLATGDMVGGALGLMTILTGAYAAKKRKDTMKLVTHLEEVAPMPSEEGRKKLDEIRKHGRLY